MVDGWLVVLFCEGRELIPGVGGRNAKFECLYLVKCSRILSDLFYLIPALSVYFSKPDPTPKQKKKKNKIQTSIPNSLFPADSRLTKI